MKDHIAFIPLQANTPDAPGLFRLEWLKQIPDTAMSPGRKIPSGVKLRGRA
jgi:hypothetical protein